MSSKEVKKKEKKTKNTNMNVSVVEESSQPKSSSNSINALLVALQRQSEFNKQIKTVITQQQQRIEALENMIKQMVQRTEEARAQLINTLNKASQGQVGAGELQQYLPLIQALSPIIKGLFGTSESNPMDEMMREMFKDAFKAFTENMMYSVQATKLLLEKLKKSEVKLE